MTVTHSDGVQRSAPANPEIGNHAQSRRCKQRHVQMQQVELECAAIRYVGHTLEYEQCTTEWESVQSMQKGAV